MTAHSLPIDLARAYEIRFFDVLDPGASGTISWTNQGHAIARITTATSESRALPTADPGYGVGTRLIVILETDGGDLSVTGAADGTVVLTDAGQAVEFFVTSDTGTHVWRRAGNQVGAASIDLDGVADALIFDADGDTTASAPTDDQLDWEIGGTDRFTFTSAGIVLAAASSVAGQGTNIATLVPDAQQEDAPDPGAISVASYLTTLTTGGAEAFSLANGAQAGQIKKIMLTVTGGDATLTLTTAADENTVVFSVVGDTVLLLWNGAAWRILQAYNEATGAITTPALSTV